MRRFRFFPAPAHVFSMCSVMKQGVVHDLGSNRKELEAAQAPNRLRSSRLVDDKGVRFDLIGAEMSRGRSKHNAETPSFFHDRGKRSEFSPHICCSKRSESKWLRS